MNRLIFLLAGVLFLLSYALADSNTAEQFEPVPAPPDIPDPLVSGQPIEPEITIIRREEAIFEEYRLNGRLYQIKVTPVVGKPYYLIDKDGDGLMETRRSTELYGDFVVPQWVLFSW